MSEDEDNTDEAEDHQVKSSRGKRKASSFKSLPTQRPEKKSKSKYKTHAHEAHIDILYSDRDSKSRSDIRRRN